MTRSIRHDCWACGKRNVATFIRKTQNALGKTVETRIFKRHRMKTLPGVWCVKSLTFAVE